MKRVWLSIGVSLVSVALAAHDTWLLPSSMAVAPGSTVTLDMTSGMFFPAPETAVKPDRLAAARCRLAGKILDISDRTAAEKSLRFGGRPQSPGVATIWAESKPRTLDLKPAEVKEYLEEIGAMETVGTEWESSPEPRKWRETYTKHAKTFLRVGNPESDGSWAEPTGMALEIIPERDPTTLAAGTDIPIASCSVAVRSRGYPSPFGLPVRRRGGCRRRTPKEESHSAWIDRAGICCMPHRSPGRPIRAASGPAISQRSP